MTQEHRALENLRAYLQHADQTHLGALVRAVAVELIVRGLPGDAELFGVAYQLARVPRQLAPEPLVRPSISARLDPADG